MDELKLAWEKIAAIYREANGYGFGYHQFKDDIERNKQVWRWNQDIAKAMIDVRENLPIPRHPLIPSLMDLSLNDLLDIYGALGFEFNDHTRVEEMLADLNCFGMHEDEE